MKDPRSTYGQYALVTGASAGIGAEFARQLAAAGMDLVLVARRGAKLEELADELGQEHQTQVEIVELDLLSDGAVDALAQRTEQLDVGLVVANAGIATVGAFSGNALQDEADVLNLNALVPMQLAHHYARVFGARGRGAIILVSSTIGHTAAPYLANYAATKAYIATLGQALNRELKPDGVDVLVLAPGPTATEGVRDIEGIDFGALPVPMMETRPVVATALKNLGRRALVIPGRVNKIMDVMSKYLTPRPVLTRMFGFLIKRAIDASARPADGHSAP